MYWKTSSKILICHDVANPNSKKINISSIFWILPVYNCEISRWETLYEVCVFWTYNIFSGIVTPISWSAYVLHFRIHIALICNKEIWKGYESLVIVRKHVSEKLIHDQLPVSSNLLLIQIKYVIELRILMTVFKC